MLANTVLVVFPLLLEQLVLAVVVLVVKHVVTGVGGDNPIAFSGNSMTKKTSQKDQS